MQIGDKVNFYGKTYLLCDIADDGMCLVYDDYNESYDEVHISKLREVTQTRTTACVTNSTHIARPRVEPIYGFNPSSYATESVVASVSKINQNKNEKEGRFNMNIKRLFGEFGKVNAGEVVLTFDGKIAVKRNADEYVRYDAEKEQIVNHLNLVLEAGSKFFYVLPVTTVAEGDIIKFKGQYFQVLEVLDNGSIKAVNLAKGTNTTICKETNAFGINFYYKVTSLVNVDGSAQAGFNPMMFALLDKDGGDFEDLLPLMLLGGQGAGDFAKNPLLMMSLLGKDGGSDISDLLMLQAFSGTAGATTDASNPFSNPLLLMTMLKK